MSSDFKTFSLALMILNAPSLIDNKKTLSMHIRYHLSLMIAFNQYGTAEKFAKLKANRVGETEPLLVVWVEIQS
ncbi:hypothetical protein [Helicobacter pylori]|uniref:hypothetical protein n=1 Tax=Helicobacter pylori TaxID=210 RepID=UPI000EABF7E2|nr:hypothetical protein [Helicobacter pylori]